MNSEDWVLSLARESLSNDFKALVGLEALHEPMDQLTLIKAFSEAAGNVEATPRLAKSISAFAKYLATCNDEHIEFFGGNLLGVNRIRFLDRDRAKWFDDILAVDEDYLRELVHSVPYIDKEWNVGADVFNLSIVWVLYKFMTSPQAHSKEFQQAMVDTLVILQFRFISSLYTSYFRRPVDRAAAEATYAAFTLKFNIKRMGSWGELMRDRAMAYISPESPHANTLKTFSPDEAVVYVVTDLQTRTRKTIKDQYHVLDQIRSGNLRIQTTQSTMSIDGDKIIKDQVNAYANARRFLLDVSGNEASFIKKPLVDIVLDLMSTTSEYVFMDMLRAIANTPVGKLHDEIDWMLESTLQHAFEYIAKNRIRFNDIGIILVKMKAMYMSSKSTDPLLLELRKRIEKYVYKNSHLRSSAALASVRTALMLYFLLRALSSSQYR